MTPTSGTKGVVQRCREVIGSWPRPSPRVVLAITWLVAVVYAYPGYMNYDVGQQLLELRTGKVTDFHPPLMGAYWRILEIFVRGPFLMLVLQLSLFLWGLYTLLCHRLERTRAAWIAAAIMIFPPVMTPMGMIWKDAQLSAFLMAGTALVLRPSWRARAAGLVLFILATGIRYNGAAALPFLLLGAAWVAGAPRDGGGTLRRRMISLAIAAGLTLGSIGVANVTNRALTDERAFNWYRTTAIFDIVGTICFAPPLTDEQVLDILGEVGLKETTAIQRTFCDLYPAGKGVNAVPPWYLYSDLFEWVPEKPARLARKRAWKRLVRTYPAAYLQHRVTIGMDLLGLNRAQIWEPVGQDFTGNVDHARLLAHEHTLSAVQADLGAAFRWLARHTPLYRVFIYAFLCAVAFALALWRRDLVVATLTGSGLLYELSLVIGANAPDFRYSHWMISCTCVGLVLLFARRRPLA